jgi:hypothetical protein
MLRACPDKVGGALTMFGALGILALWPCIGRKSAAGLVK